MQQRLYRAYRVVATLRPRCAQAAAFYGLMLDACKPREAIERYAGATYIQHNPHVGDGEEGFIACFERMVRAYPGKKVHHKRVIAEGDYAPNPLPEGEGATASAPVPSACVASRMEVAAR